MLQFVEREAVDEEGVGDWREGGAEGRLSVLIEVKATCKAIQGEMRKDLPWSLLFLHRPNRGSTSRPCPPPTGPRQVPSTCPSPPSPPATWTTFAPMEEEEASADAAPRDRDSSNGASAAKACACASRRTCNHFFFKVGVYG